MKIVLNTSTLNRGGALQVAYSIVFELTKLGSEHDFLILCSKEFYKQIKNIVLPINFSYVVIETSPAKLFSRRSINNMLDKVVRQFRGDIVLTVFGPSYWKPKIKHVCGFADGWCYYPKTIAYTQLGTLDKFKRKLLSIYKLYHIKKEVDIIFIETDDANQKLCEILKINRKKVVTVSNTYNELFNKKDNEHLRILKKREKGEIRFLLLSANYPHKNLKILNEVIPLLKGKITSFKFILTIPDSDLRKLILIDNLEYIYNIGPTDIENCKKLYEESDYLFLPTLLETFTATYPEAMIMKKLILTSDLSFSRNICKEAAIYFNPLDANHIVEQIFNIVNNPKKEKEIIEFGLKRVEDFPTARERAKKIISLCVN